MTLFRNKYRIESARLPDWDYSSAGFYFITICGKNRIQYFGTIIDKKMVLTETGIIADTFWREIPNHFTNTRLDEYVIMPNHIHGIIEIVHEITVHPVATAVPANGNATGNDAGNDAVPAVRNDFGDAIVETPKLGVSTMITGMVPGTTATKKPTLGIIINQFKRICTLTTRKKDIPFEWQPRFHDHIIRDDVSLYKIREYIKSNPLHWDSDEENPINKPPRYVETPNPRRQQL